MKSAIKQQKKSWPFQDLLGLEQIFVSDLNKSQKHKTKERQLNKNIPVNFRSAILLARFHFGYVNKTMKIRRLCQIIKWSKTDQRRRVWCFVLNNHHIKQQHVTGSKKGNLGVQWFWKRKIIFHSPSPLLASELQLLADTNMRTSTFILTALLNVSDTFSWPNSATFQELDASKATNLDSCRANYIFLCKVTLCY